MEGVECKIRSHSDAMDNTDLNKHEEKRDKIYVSSYLRQKFKRLLSVVGIFFARRLSFCTVGWRKKDISKKTSRNDGKYSKSESYSIEEDIVLEDNEIINLDSVDVEIGHGESPQICQPEIIVKPNVQQDLGLREIEIESPRSVKMEFSEYNSKWLPAPVPSPFTKSRIDAYREKLGGLSKKFISSGEERYSTEDFMKFLEENMNSSYKELKATISTFEETTSNLEISDTNSIESEYVDAEPYVDCLYSFRECHSCSAIKLPDYGTGQDAGPVEIVQETSRLEPRITVAKGIPKTLHAQLKQSADSDDASVQFPFFKIPLGEQQTKDSDNDEAMSNTSGHRLKSRKPQNKKKNIRKGALQSTNLNEFRKKRFLLNSHQSTSPGTSARFQTTASVRTDSVTYKIFETDEGSSSSKLASAYECEQPNFNDLFTSVSSSNGQLGIMRTVAVKRDKKAHSWFIDFSDNSESPSTEIAEELVSDCSDKDRMNEGNDTNSSEITLTGDGKAGHFFLRMSQIEEERLLSLAVEADTFIEALSAHEEASENVLGMLRSASGKARLLVSQRLKQFQKLCQKNISEGFHDKYFTTKDDLQGFWDMVKLQIDDVNDSFKEIEMLKENGWRKTDEDLPDTVSFSTLN